MDWSFLLSMIAGGVVGFFFARTLIDRHVNKTRERRERERAWAKARLRELQATDLVAYKKIYRLSLRLLLRHLSKQQRAEFKAYRRFTVQGQFGDHYTIKQSRMVNIIRNRDGARFCGYPDGVPLPDVLLGQKLLLETDEKNFLKSTNKEVSF